MYWCVRDSLTGGGEGAHLASTTILHTNRPRLGRRLAQPGFAGLALNEACRQGEAPAEPSRWR
jgi:hypothetical protein